MKKTILNRISKKRILDIMLGLYAVVYFSIDGFTPYFILGMVGVIPFWNLSRKKYK